MQNAIYEYGPGLYFNLTNKCPCECAFCVRAGAQGLGSAGSLWLSEEPTAAQVISQLRTENLRATQTFASAALASLSVPLTPCLRSVHT